MSKILNDAINSLFNAIVSYLGLTLSLKIIDGASKNNTLIVIVLITAFLNFILSKVENIKFVILKETIEGVLSVINGILMFIVVRLGSDMIFDGSGNSTINIIVEPIIFIIFLKAMQSYINAKLNKNK